MATGQLGALSFGTTGVSLNIISITPPQESVEDIATPHLGQALGSYLGYDPGDLVEGGEYTLELENDHDTNIPLRTKETCTWTKPPAAGNTNGAAWAFTGYIKSAQEGQNATSERSTISVVVKVAGTVTKTPGS